MMPDGAIYKNILDNLSDGIYVVDGQRTITYWNKGAERITGYACGEVLGSSCAHGILRHVDDDGKQLCMSGCPLQTALDGVHPVEAEVYLRHKNGHLVPVHLWVAPLRGSGSAIAGAIQTFRDNSQGLAMLQRLTELEETALLDPLTQLANRRYMEQHLQECFELRTRYGWRFGVLYLDIDHFKRVNDTYGHAAGDQVLKSLARTLAGNLRSFDMVGRWGGEEFLIVCPNVNSYHVRDTAERQRMLVEKSTATFGPNTLQVTVSVGATLPRAAETMEDLIRRADGLMYDSKRAGRNRVSFGL